MTHVRSKRLSRRPGSRGIGTMEVLVGGMVTVIIMLALMGFFDAQQKAYATLNTYAESQNVTRTAMDLIGRDVRMSSYDPTGAAMTQHPGPACPGVREGLAEASATALRIRQDLDADAALVTAGEDVRYLQVGDEIRRVDLSTGAGALTLVNGVANGGLLFRYFDGTIPPVEIVPAGTPPTLTRAQRACVEKIQVRIEAEIDSPVANRTALKSVVESGVAIRNRSLQKF